VFGSRFMPCPECGASLDRVESTAHRCETERMLDYQMFGLRAGVERLETSLREHLETPIGRFEMWLAARDVRRSTS
jgi:hypothetical protein